MISLLKAARQHIVQETISQFHFDETLIILDVLTIDLPNKRMVTQSGSYQNTFKGILKTSMFVVNISALHPQVCNITQKLYFQN